MKILPKSFFLSSFILLTFTSFTALSNSVNELNTKVSMKEGGQGVKAFRLKDSVLKSKSVPLDSVYLAKKKNSSLALKKIPSIARQKINNKLVAPLPSSNK